MQLGNVRCTCCVVGVYDDRLVPLRCVHACMNMMIIIVGPQLLDDAAEQPGHEIVVNNRYDDDN
jgi:homoserine acetyltransferase